MAHVILGGLFTSTLLNMLVVPAVFARFGWESEEPFDTQHEEQEAVFTDRNCCKFSRTMSKEGKRTMKPRSIVGWTLVFVWLLALPAWAVEYRLQVANLDYRTFSSYLENSTPAWRGEERMGGLEARLDKMEFPTGAVIPGRQVQLLDDPGYGGKPVLALPLPAPKGQSWTTLVWQGEPADTVAFVVKSDMHAWQEARMVATNGDGMLRRLSIGGPSLFGRPWQQVPDVSYNFIANAVDRGTFPRWMEENAKAIGGISVVVGRADSRFYRSDRVYMLTKLPPEPRTFKLVIGWKDYDSDRSAGKNR